MVSPIQNLIGIGAAGATPVGFANTVARVGAPSQLNNTAIQQVIATQVAQGVTQAGKQRITDDREVVDPSFDSEEKEAKAEDQEEEQSAPIKRKHDGTLDVLA